MAPEIARTDDEVSRKENEDRDMEKLGDVPSKTGDRKRADLYHVTSHASNHHDMLTTDNNEPASSPNNDNKYAEAGDEIYDRFSHKRKMVIVAVVSFCGFLSPISSTAVLSAVPEVAAEYNTSGSVINLSNALYLVFMGLSPVFWGPLGQVYGRRIVGLIPIRPQTPLT
jgi:hypothetical protein